MACENESILHSKRKAMNLTSPKMFMFWESSAKLFSETSDEKHNGEAIMRGNSEPELPEWISKQTCILLSEL